jgi:hypothetical protein
VSLIALVDENGSTWKEMKIGLIFYDKDIIKRGNDSNMIVKKEYVTYFGSVNEFKRMKQSGMRWGINGG